jgi:catechol 2,3-dioxygenase-like lactoylglutathione lyase family enzyme
MTNTIKTGMTGLPGLRGTDHIGLTVPDLEQAITFFTDVIGCRLVARVVLLAVSDLASFMTGSVLLADGGDAVL